jgi:signal peptide peptidase SppA
MKTINKSKNSISTAKTSINTNRSSKIDQLISVLPFWFNTKPVVAVMRLEGVIGKGGSMKSGLTISSLNKLIEKMFKIERLDAVCLCINSPGGSPVQSELISKRLTSLAKELGVPIYSFVEDVAASGGYWLACSGDKIFANKSSIIGSIGVISSGFGFHEAIGKLGIERRVIAEGKNKSVLDPFQPAKSSDVKLVKDLQKKIYEHFIETVKEHRKGRLTQTDEIIFNGEFWTGQKALDYGLIDGIDDLYSFIHKKYGNEVKVEYIENKQSWFKRKLGMSNSKDTVQELTDTMLDRIEARFMAGKFDLY